MPGGYVEMAEAGSMIFCDDGTMLSDNPCKVFFDTVWKAMTDMGRPPPTGDSLKTLLEGAGLVDVKVFRFKQPFGPWPRNRRMKQLGAMMLHQCESGWDALF